MQEPHLPLGGVNADSATTQKKRLRSTAPAAPTTAADAVDELQLLIESVQAGAALAEAAAARYDRACSAAGGRVDGVEVQAGLPAHTEKAQAEDAQVLAAWLHDASRIAALTCDQPHRVSKELGARLEALTTSLKVTFATG